MKKNIVIGVLILIIIIMGGTIYYLSTKDNSKEDCPVVEKTDDNNTETDRVESKSLIGKYTNKKVIGPNAYTLSLEVNIINDTEMTIRAIGTQAVEEITKGTYEIEDNFLTFTRVEHDNDGNGTWESCTAIEGTIGKINCSGISEINDKEYFMIDKENEKIYLTNYIGSNQVGYGPITLEIQK